jgi:hypothetical protein
VSYSLSLHNITITLVGQPLHLRWTCGLSITSSLGLRTSLSLSMSWIILRKGSTVSGKAICFIHLYFVTEQRSVKNRCRELESVLGSYPPDSNMSIGQMRFSCQFMFKSESAFLLWVAEGWSPICGTITISKSQSNSSVHSFLHASFTSC